MQILVYPRSATLFSVSFGTNQHRFLLTKQVECGIVTFSCVKKDAFKYDSQINSVVSINPYVRKNLRVQSLSREMIRRKMGEETIVALAAQMTGLTGSVTVLARASDMHPSCPQNSAFYWISLVFIVRLRVYGSISANERPPRNGCYVRK